MLLTVYLKFRFNEHPPLYPATLCPLHPHQGPEPGQGDPNT